MKENFKGYLTSSKGFPQIYRAASRPTREGQATSLWGPPAGS